MKKPELFRIVSTKYNQQLKEILKAGKCFCETCCFRHISHIHLHLFPSLLLAAYLPWVYMQEWPTCCSPFRLGRHKI